MVGTAATGCEGMSTMPLSIQKLSPALGASIDGVDLAQPLTSDVSEQIRSALFEHEVIFFRDQTLPPERHVALARLFGEPELTRHPKFEAVPDHPEVSIVINDAERPPDIDVWHTDMTFLEQPPAACVLHCIECPETGGDTLWAKPQFRVAGAVARPALPAARSPCPARPAARWHPDDRDRQAGQSHDQLRSSRRP